MNKGSQEKIFPTESAEENIQPPKGACNNFAGIKGVYALAGLILVLSFFIFKDFILLRNVYLFKDIGSDSVNWVYPNLVQLSQYVRNEGFPLWAFSQGMGKNIFPSMGNNFMGLYFLLPPEAVAYGVIYVEVLKALLSGIFFYLYLRTLSLSLYTSTLGGLLYAFSGYLVLGGCWAVFSSETVFAALLLYAFEKFFKERVWFLLPIAVTLMGIHSTFLWVPYSLFFMLYATARFFQEGGRPTDKFSTFFLKLMGLALLGGAISAVFSFSNITNILESPRVGGGASYFHALAGQPVFKTASLIELVTAIGRFFSNDMLGTGSNFRGYNNYLEAPIFYCGLASLLLVPQIFCFVDKRCKIINTGISLLCVLLIIFPFFRWAFWGFSGDYYRTLSFLMVLIVLWFSLQSLNFIDKTGRLSLRLLTGTLALLLLALFFPYFDNAKSPIDLNLRNIAAVFLAGYAVLIYFIGKRKFKCWAQMLFFAMVCVELVYFSSITVNKRLIVSAEELRSKTGYNDYSVDAIAWLNSKDSSFFRLAKTYSSGPAIHSSLNDAQVQGYYGTASYDSFNQLHYVKFLGEMGVLNSASETETRWVQGLERPFREFLLTFASVKYILAKPGINLSDKGYKLKNTIGNVSVFENDYFLPLGFTYDKYITYEKFKNLPSGDKERILLRASVVSVGDVKNFSDIEAFDLINLEEQTNRQNYSKYVNALKEESLVLTAHKQNRLQGNIELNKKKVLFFSIPYDKGWKAWVDGKPTELHLVNVGFMGLILEPGRHRVVLEFTPPLLLAGALVSGVGILVYVILLWHSCRKPKATKSEDSD